MDGPIYVKADNMLVIKNSSIPETQLRKKSNSIASCLQTCCGKSNKGNL